MGRDQLTFAASRRCVPHLVPSRRVRVAESKAAGGEDQKDDTSLLHPAGGGNRQEKTAAVTGNQTGPGKFFVCIATHCVYNGLTFEVILDKPDYRSRRWTVIASGLLCGSLAVIVLFTNRGAFFSPLAVVVMGAVGLAAVLLQLRLQNRDQAQSSRSPAWLNVLGILFALAAFLGDLLNLRAPLVEALALGAVASFGVSGLLILRSFRKGLAAK
jgi:hypothetical protein